MVISTASTSTYEYMHIERIYDDNEFLQNIINVSLIAEMFLFLSCSQYAASSDLKKEMPLIVVTGR